MRVFINGAKCGDLCFRNHEFYDIRHSVSGVTFVCENDPEDLKNIEEAEKSMADPDSPFNRCFYNKP